MKETKISDPIIMIVYLSYINGKKLEEQEMRLIGTY